ncbi:unnamed protein product, partial [Rangifer tarandus platyrhynchus]
DAPRPSQGPVREGSRDRNRLPLHREASSPSGMWLFPCTSKPQEDVTDGQFCLPISWVSSSAIYK